MKAWRCGGTSLFGLAGRLRDRTLRAHCGATKLAMKAEETFGAPSGTVPELRPPEKVLGMTELDREAFATTVEVPTLEADVRLGCRVLSAVRSCLLKLPNFKPVQDSTEENRKTFFLDPTLVGTPDALSPEARSVLKECGVENLGLKEISLGYDNWPAETVLRAVLGQPDAAGYSVIGHLLHLNLRPHLEPYKKLIGQVYLDKVKNITCVVNKASVIESTYRNFAPEVLAGEPRTEVSVRENGVRFEFDFAEVYWNPRLSTEHWRVVSGLGKGDVLYDVFAGVGPFAIPAAKRGCVCFANDLNPQSFKWLTHNVSLNKVDDLVTPYNLDGREFLVSVFGRLAPEQLNEGKRLRLVMNLPSIAPQFLDALVGVIGKDVLDLEVARRPLVHCYCFSNPEKGRALEAALRQVQEGLGADPVGAEVKFVRSVAPNKDMMRVTFELPFEVLVSESDPPAKKCRLEDDPS